VYDLSDYELLYIAIAHKETIHSFFLSAVGMALLVFSLLLVSKYGFIFL